jgi:anti-anti-sigma factor
MFFRAPAEVAMHWTEIRTRHRGDVTVIDLRGHLTLGDEDRRLMPEVERLLGEGRHLFLLNLQHLSYVDSTGVGEIVGVYTRVTRHGGDVKLCHVPDRVQEILDSTRLDSVLQVIGTEEEALAIMAHE